MICCMRPDCRSNCAGRELANDILRSNFADGGESVRGRLSFPANPMNAPGMPHRTPADAKVARWMRWYGFLLIVLVAVGAALAQIVTNWSHT